MRKLSGATIFGDARVIAKQADALAVRALTALPLQHRRRAAISRERRPGAACGLRHTTAGNGGAKTSPLPKCATSM